MRNILLILFGVLITASGCSPAADEQEASPADGPPVEKALTLANAAAVDTALLENVRTYVQKELNVPVRIIDIPELAGKENFQALETAALAARHTNDVSYIVVVKMDDGEHLRVDADKGIAVINAAALHSDDIEKFTGRIRRMVMRAAAFSFGLEPTPDPFCVTRDYTSLEDLDRMGNNYSPPWQVRYAEEAAARGLRSFKKPRTKPPIMR